MAISFPTTPADGDIYTSTEGRSFKYSATLSAWNSFGGGADSPAYLTAKPTVPKEGMVYYDTTTDVLEVYNETVGAWETVSSSPATQTSYGTLYGLTRGYGGGTGERNTFLGYNTGSLIESGAILNTFIGLETGLDVTTATRSTFVGAYSGRFNTTGSYNTGMGAYACQVGTGEYNTSIGYTALGSSGSTNVNYNTAIGYKSLASNSTGSGNSAIGSYTPVELSYNNNIVLAKTNITNNRTLQFNEDNAMGIATWNSSSPSADWTNIDYGTLGYVLTSQGTTAPPTWSPASAALANLNVAGSVYGLVEDDNNNNHTFLGWNAGNATVEANGGQNTFIGQTCGFDTTSQDNSTFVGYFAGYGSTSGRRNIALGNYTCSVGIGENNVAIGYATLGNGGDKSNNTAVGNQCLPGSVGSGNTVIGTYDPNDVNFSDNLALAKTTSSASNLVLHFNSDNAMGIAVWNSTTPQNGRNTVDFGSAGDVLVSQGTTAPPQWTTGASGSFTAGAQTVTVTNGIITSIV